MTGALCKRGRGVRAGGEGQHDCARGSNFLLAGLSCLICGFFPSGVRFSRGAAPTVKLESSCPREQSHSRKRAESSGCLPF